MTYVQLSIYHRRYDLFQWSMASCYRALNKKFYRWCLSLLNLKGYSCFNGYIWIWYWKLQHRNKDHCDAGKWKNVIICGSYILQRKESEMLSTLNS